MSDHGKPFKEFSHTSLASRAMATKRSENGDPKDRLRAIQLRAAATLWLHRKPCSREITQLERARENCGTRRASFGMMGDRDTPAVVFMRPLSMQVSESPVLRQIGVNGWCSSANLSTALVYN